MRTLTAGQISHLANTRAFLIADCYTFTLASGTIYKWTTWDADVNGFTHGGPILTRTGARFTAGRETSTMDITLGGAGFLLGSVRLPLAAARGVFYGAAVLLERLFMPTPGDASLGAIPWFEGYVAEVAPTSTTVKLTVKSRLERLNVPMPRRTFQPACTHVLYDAACGVTKATYTETKAVASGTALAVTFTDTTSTGYYLGGAVRFITGANAGIVRLAATHTVAGGNGTVTFDTAFPYTPQNGDQLQISRGCNKAATNPNGTPGDCAAKFNNLTRFGGFPFVPKPESAR
jgi:uncharacterized phage protein (TIGR02218 family)